MVKHYGVQGAAIAWTARVLLDTTFLLITGQRFLRQQDRFLGRMGASIACALILFWVATWPSTLPQRTVFLAAALLLLLGISLIYFLPEERRWVRLAVATRACEPQSSEIM
jgi:hypothetical protein